MKRLFSLKTAGFHCIMDKNNGVVWAQEHGARRKESMQKKETKGVLGEIVACVKGYWLPTLLTPLLMVCEVVMEVLIPMLMAAIVDGGLYRQEDFLLKEYFSPELIANNSRFILVLGGLMVLFSLLSLFFGALGARTGAVATMGFSKNLRKKIFDKIETFSFANTDKFSVPSLVMRCTTDVTNLQNTFSQLIRMLFRGPFMIVLAAIMAFRIDTELSRTFLIALPMLAIALVLLLKTGFPRFTAMFKKYDVMNASLQENLVAVREVKSFVRQDYEKERFDDAAVTLRKAQVYAEKMLSLTGPIQMLVMWTCTMVLWALGGRRVMIVGDMHAGALTSLISYTGQIVGSLGMISFISVSIAMAKVSYNRIGEILREQPDIQGPDNHLAVDNGQIDFDHVSFSYNKSPETLTLEDIDLHIAPGETIGVVGGTGDGKSTLVQLIPRFYDVLSGEVRLGGRNVKEYPLFELRESVSMVLQKNTLFTGTIYDNLRWGNPNATREQVEEACKAACAHEFICRFPKGYETELGQGGVNVSGGQKQRLCIARALLKNPKVLILDDSTSAVDSATDEAIRKSLREALPQCTKLIIAQRIASVRHADRIVVMEKGRIIDVGNHEALMERCDVYRQIYASQTKGEQEQRRDA